MTTQSETFDTQKLNPRKWVKFIKSGWLATAKLHPSGRKLLHLRKQA